MNTIKKLMSVALLGLGMHAFANSTELPVLSTMQEESAELKSIRQMCAVVHDGQNYAQVANALTLENEILRKMILKWSEAYQQVQAEKKGSCLGSIMAFAIIFGIGYYVGSIN